MNLCTDFTQNNANICSAQILNQEAFLCLEVISRRRQTTCLCKMFNWFTLECTLLFLTLEERPVGRCYGAFPASIPEFLFCRSQSARTGTIHL